MLLPRIPKKEMKCFCIRNGGAKKINDSECLRDLFGGWEVSSRVDLL
jgi:hypothetical protein